ncbi:hypothetical protein EYF80_039882 [Liparis tanakae]|uniref:Uncharacterized protein n=1 Tax=Liparis tanakae TaxID=230148 RepID=A0A4Z2GB89_9TELE|nr:hypothetical protein EYF80_039882 [Liparis tanakae]
MDPPGGFFWHRDVGCEQVPISGGKAAAGGGGASPQNHKNAERPGATRPRGEEERREERGRERGERREERRKRREEREEGERREERREEIGEKREESVFSCSSCGVLCKLFLQQRHSSGVFTEQLSDTLT